MGMAKRRRAAAGGGGRHAVVDRLEGRRLMSLTVSLRDATTGAASAVVTPGEVLTLNVVATVTAPDGSTAYDALRDVTGSFLSAAVGPSAVAGNLAVQSVAPFNALGATTGTAADLNGDGNVDDGSNDLTSPGIVGYFLARSDAVQTSADGTVSGDSVSFTIATVTYTVTAVNDGGQTNLTFRPRDTSHSGAVAARWAENSSTSGSDEYTGTFRGGSPFQVYGSAAQQAGTGTVTATVYNDANGNGARDAGEGGLGGATVYVDLGGTGSYAAGDPSAVTATNGVATITGVPAGAAVAVRLVPPTGDSQTQPAAAGGYAVTPTAGGTVSAGAFGAEANGSIAGSAFIDGNGNGVRDAGETAVPPAGTAVFLDANGNGVDDAGEARTTTFADGAYLFASVTPGTYAVRIVVPAGDAASVPAGGVRTVALTPGAAVTGETFGLAPIGAIAGTVFGDANGDGVEGANESGLAGATVYVDANGDGVLDDGEPSAVTDATGAYTIAGVAAGTYAVRALAPAAGFAVTTPAGGVQQVSDADGQTATAQPFGFGPSTVVPGSGPGSITGTVFADANGNGVRDAGEAAAGGATVYLDANGNGRLDAGEPSAVTAADGTYAFANLAAGTYTVRELVPLGDAGTSTSGTGSYGVAVAAGGTVGGNDFGVVPLGASPLSAAVVTGPKVTATAGDAGTVRVRVTDPSKTAAFAGPVTVSVYAVVGGVVFTQDVAVGTVTKTLKLRPGKSAVVAVKYALPLTLATGSYTVVAAAATADATGTSPTIAPALAAAAGPVAVAAATVDLSPTIVAPAAGVALRAGKRSTVAVRVTNTGTVTAAGTVTVTVGSVAVDGVSGTRTVAVKVRPGRSVVVAVPVTTAASAAVGSLRLVATVASTTTPADDNAADDSSAAVATR